MVAGGEAVAAEVATVVWKDMVENVSFGYMRRYPISTLLVTRFQRWFDPVVVRIDSLTYMLRAMSEVPTPEPKMATPARGARMAVVVCVPGSRMTVSPVCARVLMA